MFEGVTEQVVDFAIGTKFDDLPPEVVHKTKLLLLDAIGCALGGYVTDRAKLAIEFIQESGGSPQGTIIGGHRSSYALAAFANGELINALDSDSIGPLTGHVSPYVISPCLAAAERARASGKELITALAVAHEIGGRFGASLAGLKVLKEEPPYYEESPRFTHAYTFFGGVAGTGRLLGLEVRQMAHAFGIAGASAPVPAGIKWEHIVGPAIMVKYNAWTGWVSQLAIVAALLAEKGFTGDTTILDGDHGFWQIVGSPFFKVDVLLENLGDIWNVQNVDFKLYPTCRNNHAGIEGINKIMQEHGIEPEEIQEILIKADPLLLTPNRMTTELEGFSDMQFSNANIFAVAACYGDSPGPAWQMPTVYNDVRVRSLVKKVKVEKHPQAEEFITRKIKASRLPVFWETIVELTARGKKFVTEVNRPKGTPSNPLTDTELVEKFKVNASYSMLPSSRVEEIIQTIGDLERLDDSTILTTLLAVR